MNAEPRLCFGRFVLLPTRRQLLWDGAPVVIGSRALDVLQVLIEHRDRTVLKDELLDKVWSGRVVEEANIHVQVSALRKLLGADAIATLPGQGYRFTLPHASETDIRAGDGRTDLRPLPAHDALIAREHELAAVLDLLQAPGLVTLVGTAGVGKTRLAQAVQQALDKRWAGGAAWVSAAPLTDLPQLAQAVAAASGSPVADARDPLAVAAAIGPKPRLLLIDNCEHLIDAATALVEALSPGGERAPGLRMVLTSRRALRIAGERVIQVEPLPLPAPGQVGDDSVPALRLFALRARSMDPGFNIDAGNVAAVADICRRLDGLPLAIELAAARVRALGVQGVQERLAQRLRLLSHSHPQARSHHQTLVAALDWSFSRLTAPEQAVLRRLSVFAGGFTIELAQAVASDGEGSESGLDGWAVLDATSALIEHSLLQVHAAPAEGGAVRYRLLETVRLFAGERLAEAGERSAVTRRHAQAVTALFETSESSRWEDDGQAGAGDVMRLLVPEVDNVTAALSFALGENDYALAVRLAGAAAPVMAQVGRSRAWAATLRALLPHLESAPLLAQTHLLWRLGSIGIQDGMSHQAVLEIKQRAVVLARSVGSRRRLIGTLTALGFTLARQGDLLAAEQIVVELRTLERADDSPTIRAMPLQVALMLHEQRGELEQVVNVLYRQRALLLGEPREVQPLITAEANLVMYLNTLGRHAEAGDLGRELLSRCAAAHSFVPLALFQTVYALAATGATGQALQLLRSNRDEAASSAIAVYGLEGLARLCLEQGRLDDAVRIDAMLGANQTDRRVRPHPLTESWQRHLQHRLATQGVAESARSRWQVEGQAMSPQAALALALR